MRTWQDLYSSALSGSYQPKPLCRSPTGRRSRLPRRYLASCVSRFALAEDSRLLGGVYPIQTIMSAFGRSGWRWWWWGRRSAAPPVCFCFCFVFLGTFGESFHGGCELLPCGNPLTSPEGTFKKKSLASASAVQLLKSVARGSRKCGIISQCVLFHHMLFAICAYIYVYIYVYIYIYVGDMTRNFLYIFRFRFKDCWRSTCAHHFSSRPNFCFRKQQNYNICSHIVLLSNVSSSEFAFGRPALCSLFGEEEDEFKKKIIIKNPPRHMWACECCFKRS